MVAHKKTEEIVFSDYSFLNKSLKQLFRAHDFCLRKIIGKSCYDFHPSPGSKLHEKLTLASQQCWASADNRAHLILQARLANSCTLLA